MLRPRGNIPRREVSRRPPKHLFQQWPIPHLSYAVTQRFVRSLLVVLAVVVLVHQTLIRPPAMAESASASRDLPPPVAEMRDRLLAAVASGDIEDLNEPLAWNELPIVFGSAEDGDDPIAHWQRISADGKGIQVLEDMGRALALPPARLAIGRDVENAGVYVWPYLSERALDRLTVEEEKDLRTLNDGD